MKKLINFTRILGIAVAVCILMGVISTFAISNSTLHIESEDNYFTALNEYFIIREQQFTSSSSKIAFASEQEGLLSGTMAESQSQRVVFLNSWADDIKITVDSVDVSYDIKSILNSDDNETKFLVYEWVWINYHDILDVPDLMGFGTDHIITMTYVDGSATVTSDAYMEITGFTDGDEKDLLTLMSLKDEPTNHFDKDNFSEAYEVAMLTASYYNPSDAADFAETYAGVSTAGTSSGTQHPLNYCPYVYYYSSDCANFVSQCLRAGGLQSTIASGWWSNTQATGSAQPDTSNTQSTTSWMRVTELRDYLIGLGYTQNRIYDSSEATKGNPIYYADGSNQHIVMIVDVTASGNVLICGHTNDAYRFVYNGILSSNTCYTINMT